ncbi:MAG: branched-chain amino acid ABC transporter permease [Firmicutes bacterium]|jgi:inner-membrane translocator|nr:branched-chain amino acid ABC transporter permease [Bacillota bacterium]
MEFVSTLINGLSLGSIYALIALGYTMVYGIAKMLNFAHGDIIMVGAYSVFVFLGWWNMPLVAMLFAVVVCCALGFAVEKCAYKPLRGASPLAVLITAIGVSYLLQGVAQVAFGSAPENVDIAIRFGGKTWFQVGGITISYSTVVTLVVGALLMAGLTVFIKRTRTGRAMLALSEDRGAAQLMGVNANALISLTFIIGSALAAVAGSFYLMQIPTVTPSTGALPGIKAFTAAVIGGIGSIPGAMLGGILLGIVEKICESVPVLAPFTTAIEFGLLILILLIKPTGLLGVKRREKV